MKNYILLTGILISIFGLTAFRTVEKHHTADLENIPPTTISNVRIDTITKQFGFEVAKIKTPPKKKLVQYRVKENYTRPVSKQTLNKAKSLSDIIPDYPSKWITSYTSVEISIIHNGRTQKENSPTDVLTQEQKAMLSSAEYSSILNIIVNSTSENSATREMESQEMNVTMTIAPETSAEFIGGYDQMMTYLYDNSDEKLSEIELVPMEEYVVLFTVNETGTIENVRLSKISGDPEIDILLVELISNMPNWKPAESSNGSSVKQDFEFIVGTDGC